MVYGMTKRESIRQAASGDRAVGGNGKRILILDDHRLTREVVKANLEQERRFDVTVVELVSDAELLIKRDGPFDCVLVDFSLPGEDGYKVAQKILEYNSPKPVTLFSGTIPEHIAYRLIRLGVSGFFPKTMALSTLKSALDFVLTGERYIPAELMLNSVTASHPFEELLTQREKAVLDGICRGLTNKQISDNENISLALTKAAVRKLCEKLNVRNRTALAMIAEETAWQWRAKNE